MIDSSGLGKRKAYILATVVYEYIATAEPVGSQSLTLKYNLGISSATQPGSSTRSSITRHACSVVFRTT